MDELVIGGAEQRIAGVGTEACPIDQRLRVLDAEANGERLGFHEHTRRMQHLEGVARAVAEGEDDLAGGDFLSTRQRYAAHVSFLDVQSSDAALEANLPAARDDLGAHALDHADQPEGTDVRMRDVEDFLGCPGFDEFGQHLASEMARILDLAVEFAVRKGAGAALAELHVRLRVQLVIAPQFPGVFRAFAHGLAALQHQRLEAHLRQDQRGEDAGRPEADDHRALRQVLRRLRHEVVARVGTWLDARIVGKACEYRHLVIDVQIDRVDEQQRILLARIVAALENGEFANGPFGDAQACGDGAVQCFRRMLQRQAKFVDADHQAPARWP